MKKSLMLLGVILSVCVYADIYEIIDKNGHKTYTDKPPSDQTDLKPIKVAPETSNSWQNGNAQEQNDQFFDELKKQQDEEKAAADELSRQEEERQQKAEDAVAEAEAELERARELKAGDYFPNKQKGMHYTPEYINRVKNAEKALEKAKAVNNQ
jgi:hypothetical protein